MVFTKFIRKLRNSHAEINGKKPEGICAAGDFARIVKRERARADRGGHHFAVIYFNIEKSKLTGASPEALLNLLSKRVRLTDEFGWIDKYHIGVMLFNAGADVACRFAGEIRDELSRTVTSLDFCVYTYPHDFLDRNDGGGNNGNGRKNNDSTENQNSKDPDEQMLAAPVIKAVKDISPLIVRKIPVWKRIFDITLASIALILCFPLFLIIGLLIKTVSSGPVFFKQERIGYGGKRFDFLKFRTMKVNADTCAHQCYLSDLINESCSAEEAGRPMAKLDHSDSQIIPFGNFLRNSCLDELPQLINVLRGEMSLVGPRPPIPYEVAEYLKWHHGRFDIVPGMTGLWQVSGKNRLTFKEMIRLDIRYARTVSLYADLKILCKTPWQ